MLQHKGNSATIDTQKNAEKIVIKSDWELTSTLNNKLYFSNQT